MSWQQPNYDPNVPYGQYGEQQYGMQPTGQYQQYGQPTGWTSTPQYQPQQPQQQWQQSPQTQQQQASGASWLESYQIGPYEAKLREAFNHWDKNQSGHIDAQELEQAMKELGESDITPDTVPLMIEMFDKDKSGTIDFTEFGELFAYIQDMKGAFQNADANGERALNMDQVKMALGRVHGPLLYAGGAALAFALFKLYDKKRKGTLDWPNFLKTALRFGSLRTGFEHSNQQQQAQHGKPQQQSYPQQQSSYPPQQQQYSQGLGQFQQSYPPQQQSYNQYSMGTGTGSYSQQPQQYGFAKDPSMVDQFVEFASNFIDMQRK